MPPATFCTLLGAGRPGKRCWAVTATWAAAVAPRSLCPDRLARRPRHRCCQPTVRAAVAATIPDWASGNVGCDFDGDDDGGGDGDGSGRRT